MNVCFFGNLFEESGDLVIEQVKATDMNMSKLCLLLHNQNPEFLAHYTNESVTLYENRDGSVWLVIPITSYGFALGARAHYERFQVMG